MYLLLTVQQWHQAAFASSKPKLISTCSGSERRNGLFNRIPAAVTPAVGPVRLAVVVERHLLFHLTRGMQMSRKA